MTPAAKSMSSHTRPSISEMLRPVSRTVASIRRSRGEQTPSSRSISARPSTLAAALWPRALVALEQLDGVGDDPATPAREVHHALERRPRLAGDGLEAKPRRDRHVRFARRRDQRQPLPAPPGGRTQPCGSAACPRGASRPPTCRSAGGRCRARPERGRPVLARLARFTTRVAKTPQAQSDAETEEPQRLLGFLDGASRTQSRPPGCDSRARPPETPLQGGIPAIPEREVPADTTRLSGGFGDGTRSIPKRPTISPGRVATTPARVSFPMLRVTSSVYAT